MWHASCETVEAHAGSKERFEPMKIVRKRWRLLVFGLASALLLMVGVAWAWVVPAVIVGQIRSQYGGRVTIEGWWIGSASAGVKGLVLHEGPENDAPVWASSRRVETDLSIGGMLRGRFEPGRIELFDPIIEFRFDAEGQPLTQIPIEAASTDPTEAPPSLVLRGGQVRIEQQGRPEMIVKGVDASMLPTSTGGAQLKASTDDPYWGSWRATGTLEPGFLGGRILLQGQGIDAEPEKVIRIPFVPVEVWENVEPHGPVDVRLAVLFDAGADEPVQAHTEVQFRNSVVTLPPFGFTAEETTGALIVEPDGLVRLEAMQGQALGGRVLAAGSLDFRVPEPVFRISMTLEQVEVARTPESWQLGEIGLTSGQMSGEVDLKVVLAEDRVDFSGTTGEAVIREALVGEIPVKSLRLVLTAEGDELQYDTPGSRSSGSAATTRKLLGALNLIALQMAELPGIAVSLPIVQDPPPVEPAAVEPDEPAQAGPSIQLPRTISTEIELEDVDLRQIAERLQTFNITLPIELSGRFSLKAEATIPLRTLNDLTAYRFEGEATLTSAHIAGMDFGRARAKLSLVEGVLDLTDFVGQFVSRPDGTADNPPEESDRIPLEGPLPDGAFRGHLRAELSPAGEFRADFEAVNLPLEELAAPALPHPTPLTGRLSLNVIASAEVEQLADPNAWDLSGTLLSESITYHGKTLETVRAEFAIDDGRFHLGALDASLNDRPLSGSGSVALAEPYAFDVRLNVDDWSLDDLLVFVLPEVPDPAPVSGTLALQAEAEGTIQPLELETKGKGLLGRFRAGPVELEEVPFDWESAEGDILVRVREARPFDGRLSAEARVPLTPERPVLGFAVLEEIDMEQVARTIPGEALQLGGRAGGRIDFDIPLQAGPDDPMIHADVVLVAPDLTVQGIPARGVTADLNVREGVLEYEIFAESLGGRLRFRGDFPLSATSGVTEAQVQVQLVGFRLANVWPLLGIDGATANLRGLGAADANVLVTLDPFFPRASAVVEVRELNWGGNYPLGRLRASIGVTPLTYQVHSLTGEILGGSVDGSARPEGIHRTAFDLRVDRVSLPRLLAFEPALARRVQGTGRLSIKGVYGETLRATGEARISNAQVAGVRVTDLRLPMQLNLSAGGQSGAFEVRRAYGRISGGQVRGNARFGLGNNRAFSSTLQLGSVDLEGVSRLLSDAPRPASGRVSGRITLSGRDPEQLQSYRGQASLDLDDAALFDLPIFRELSQFLGSSRGGIFETGHLEANIANRQIHIDEFYLIGRLAQMRATGTIDFNTNLDIVVLVNTNQIIPQTGEALMTRIPGLAGVIGDRQLATRRVADFLSNRLLKLHVTGNLQNPHVFIDPAVVVTDAAVGFFSGVLKLPLGALR
ncbi:hypothetical protein BH23PLA1_BH23PLA1_17310 [soil metagenome]